MDLVTHPVRFAFTAVPGFNILGRLNEVADWGFFRHGAPADLVLLVSRAPNKLLYPDLPQDANGREMS